MAVARLDNLVAADRFREGELAGRRCVSRSGDVLPARTSLGKKPSVAPHRRQGHVPSGGNAFLEVAIPISNAFGRLHYAA